MCAIFVHLSRAKARSLEPHELLESQLAPAWLLQAQTYDSTSAPPKYDSLVCSHCFDDRGSIASLLGNRHVSTSISRAARVTSSIIRQNGKFPSKDISRRGVEACIFHGTRNQQQKWTPASIFAINPSALSSYHLLNWRADMLYFELEVYKNTFADIA